MNKLLKSSLIACTALLVAAGPVFGAIGQPVKKNQLTDRLLTQARVLVCHPERSLINSYVIFEGRMSSVTAGEQLEMRFELFARDGTSRAFKRVDVPGKLGVWHRADAAISNYRFQERIENLAGPADYRARVQFRWRGKGRTMTRTLTRITPTCIQPLATGALH